MNQAPPSLMASTKRTLDEATADAVGKLANMYEFSLDEALRKLSIGDAARPRKKAMVSSAALLHAGISPSIPLPFCGTVVPGWCKGVRYNRGLFTQCSNVPGRSSAPLCSTCAKVSTRPVSCGDISDRADADWRDRRGRKPVKYSVVAAKLGISRLNATEEAAKFGWVIPDSEFAEPGAPRRGRPPKEKPIVSSIGNSLLDDLVAGARALTINPPAETKAELMHRLFGSDSDSDTESGTRPDDEPEESFSVVPIFIKGTEYLHCSATSLVYDLHTQTQVGTLSPEGKLVAC